MESMSFFSAASSRDFSLMTFAVPLRWEELTFLTLNAVRIASFMWFSHIPHIIPSIFKSVSYRNVKITDCMIPYWPDAPDTYTVPPELAHIVAYDKEVHALRLISSVTAKEARSIFERDTIPENEFNILKKIIYRFVDYCAMGYVRVPHEIPEFVLDFSHGDYVDDERNRSLDDTDAKLVALRRRVGADLWSVTVMLVNGRKESPVKANRCIFQAKLKVSSENNDFVFAESNPHADTTAMDSEEQSLDLLYRHKKYTELA